MPESKDPSHFHNSTAPQLGSRKTHRHSSDFFNLRLYVCNHNSQKL
jgi:hypothetical protein